MREAAENSRRPTRLGICGFGRLAQSYYVPALRRLRDVHIIAVADPAVACRAAAAHLLPGAALYTSQQAMLDAEHLDGLLVASPPSAHLGAWEEAALRPSLAVFMEKPFVLGGELAAASRLRDARARLMVNFNRRFWPRYRRLGELLRSGAVGTLLSAELELQVDVSRWLSVTQHRVQKGEGGALYDLGSQMLDLAAVLIGERPTAVHVTGTSKQWEADHLEVALTFPSHAACDVRCLLAYDNTTRERIVVRGAEGEIRIDNPNTALHVVRRDSLIGGLSRRAADVATLGSHAVLRHTSMSRRTIELALAAFVGRLRDGGPFSPGFDDAVFSATLLEAASRSLITGRTENVEPARSTTAATEVLV